MASQAPDEIPGPPDPPTTSMVARIRLLLASPGEEWPRIAEEPATIGGLMRGWVVPLAAIGPVAGLIGSLVFGTRALGLVFRPSLSHALASAVLAYAATLVSIYVTALVINALAPTFDGQKDPVRAMKLAAYAGTAGLLAGIFTILPWFAFLSILGLYSIYLLYIGLPVLMRAPREKALGYTALTIVAAGLAMLATSYVAGMVVAAITPRPLISGGTASGTLTVPGVGSVDVGKLDEAGKRLQRGDVKPVPVDQLKAMLPGDAQGWKRGDVETSSASAGNIGGGRAEADYAKGEQSLRLSVTDMGAIGALSAIGSAINVKANRETATGYERFGSEGGRMTNEKWDRDSRDGSYSVVIANRFVVEASGQAGDVGELKRMVESVDLARLERMAAE